MDGCGDAKGLCREVTTIQIQPSRQGTCGTRHTYNGFVSNINTALVPSFLRVLVWSEIEVDQPQVSQLLSIGLQDDWTWLELLFRIPSS